MSGWPVGSRHPPASLSHSGLEGVVLACLGSEVDQVQGRPEGGHSCGGKDAPHLVVTHFAPFLSPGHYHMDVARTWGVSYTLRCLVCPILLESSGATWVTALHTDSSQSSSTSFENHMYKPSLFSCSQILGLSQLSSAPVGG